MSRAGRLIELLLGSLRRTARPRSWSRIRAFRPASVCRVIRRPKIGAIWSGWPIERFRSSSRSCRRSSEDEVGAVLDLADEGAVAEPLVAALAVAGGEAGAGADEHPAEAPILEVERALPDEAVEERDVVALAGGADGHAGVLAGLEDGGHAGLALQASIGRLDPLLTADALGGTRISTCRRSEGLDEAVVVGGDGPEVGGGHPVRPAFLPEEADDAGGVPQDLDGAVEEDAVEAGVVEANGRPVVHDEGVPGGPPCVWGRPR